MKIALALAFICVGASALAEPVPEEVIQVQHQACVARCSQSGAVSADRCDASCKCGDDEVRNNFTLEEYMKLSEAVDANPDSLRVSTGLQEKVNRMMKRCWPNAKMGD